MADVSISGAVEASTVAESVGLLIPFSTVAVDSNETALTNAMFAAAVVPKKRKDSSGYLNISIRGTFTGTVTLQRSFDKGSTWRTVKTWTAGTEESLTDHEVGVMYRLGIAPGGYTSGTAVVRLGVGG